MTHPAESTPDNSPWDTLRQAIDAAVAAENVVSILFRKPEPNENDDSVNNGAGKSGESTARIRPLQNSDQIVYQCTRQVGRQAVHENVVPSELAGFVERLLRQDFRAGTLQTTTADYILKRRTTGRLKIQQRKPTKTEVVAESHNRERPYLIPDGQPCPFLAEMGVMNADGHVRKSKYHKFRQINRFAELVNDIVDELPDDRPIRVLDFGCGRSYLTFALHYLLKDVRQRTTDILGIDCRADVIQSCDAIAKKLQPEGLTFQQVDIVDAKLPWADMDLAVSLHACNTATDDALSFAVRNKARVIFSVPCCQHELSGQIQSEPLTAVTEHGLFRERFNQLATDSLRVKALTACGYETQVVEFIDLEHTGRNVLLRGILRPNVERQQRARAAYAEFKSFLGLGDIHCDTILAEASGL